MKPKKLATKPWEETWRAEGVSIVRGPDAADDSHKVIVDSGAEDGVLPFAAASPELYRALHALLEADTEEHRAAGYAALEKARGER